MGGSLLVPAIGVGLALLALIAVDAGRYGLAGVLAVLVAGAALAVARGERRRLRREDPRHVR